MIPRNGGISFSGKTLNVTGDAQGRFRLACQPRICYVNPAEAGLNQRLPCVKGGGIFEENDRGIVKKKT